MNATELVADLSKRVHVELANVRRQYTSLDQAARLARRHGAASIEDAFFMEARARVKRNAWAAVTSEAA